MPGPPATPRPRPVAVPHRVSEYAPPMSPPAPGLPEPVPSPRTPLPEHPPPVRKEVAPGAPNLQLPPHRNKLQRIADQVEGAAEDVRAVASLATEYVEEKTEALKARVKWLELKAEAVEIKVRSWLPAVPLLLGAAIVLLLTLAFFFSALIEEFLLPLEYLWSLTLGYLFTGLLLIAVALVLHAVFRKKVLREKRDQVRESARRPPPADRPPPATEPTR